MISLFSLLKNLNGERVFSLYKKLLNIFLFLLKLFKNVFEKFLDLL
jgi:hypothetical protein